MKVQSTILFLSFLLASSVFGSESDLGLDYNGDFFQGMESGFFLRDTKDGHREYDCPDPQVDQNALRQVNAILAPVQMLLGLANNDFINTAFN